MLLGRILFFVFFIHLVNLEIQINFHLTDWEVENNDIQHDCLNVAARIEEEYGVRQIISYCMGEWPSKFQITENNFDQKFNFSQLSKEHVTTEQLYRWSASIDLIEEYQDYLNQLPYSDQRLARKIFFNCTLPYFGSKCQYTFNTSYVNHSSLNDIVYDYYYYNRYEPTQFTCYDHLECDRGPSPSCLDWTEICDGKVDCLNEGLDEKDCWKLEIHQCQENEYKCSYGQCIPKSFVHDGPYSPDCLDQLDEYLPEIFGAFDALRYVTTEPIFAVEDISCAKLFNLYIESRQILTSSCTANRELLLSQAMFSIKPSSITNNKCWTVVKCIMHMPDSLEPTIWNFLHPPPTNCSQFCDKGVCDNIAAKMCPEIIYVPAYPILHGHIYLAYDKTKLKYAQRHPLEPTYVCYNTSRLYIPNDNKTFLLTNNNTCRLYADSKVGKADTWETRWLQLFIGSIGRWLHRVTPLIYDNFTICNQSIMYQCMNSAKCISKTQVIDFVSDCYYEDDEDLSKLSNTDLIKQLNNIFKCPTTDKYISFFFVNDGFNCDCTGPGDDYCADENSGKLHFNKTISFQTTCDKTIHLSPEFIEDKNETDETNCEHWPLLHVYNRCDGFWHFLNGSDETDCDLSFLSLNCPKNNHICISRQTKELICLPIEKANDGIVDCIGGADEPTICQRNNYSFYPRVFACENNLHSSCIAGHQLCDGKYNCNNKEDELFCMDNDLQYSKVNDGICTGIYELYGSIIAKILCRLFFNTGIRSRVYFTLDQSPNSVKNHPNSEAILISMDDPDVLTNVNFNQQHCHRGFPLQIWLDKQKNLTKDVCLCPPSFYGNICQYQNQRLSITLQFRATSDSSQIPFIFIISLIDDSNERIIHSYELFNYLFTKYCQRKFNFYLLYSTRPKNSARQYSIHIDVYEQITLNYRASFIKSVNYSFLPVHRLVFQFDIPYSPDNIQTCSNKQCINGKCIKYFNDPNKKYFCQCYKGWSGKSCTIKYTCSCSSQSLCLGKLANNRSLCVCPLNKMGPRCLINDPICQNTLCMNGGTCVRSDDYDVSQKKFTCICSKDFFGDRCEMNRTKLILSFEQSLDFYPTIFIHFIEVQTNDFPVRTTTFKRIPTEQNSIIMHWSLPFHILFIELMEKYYYLTIMQEKYKYEPIIEKTLTAFNRCLHINELFNETFLKYHLIRRIKYYHLPCQTNLSLSCFYDEQQFCMCQKLNQQRLSNCFDFDRNSRTICATQNDCENGGKCYQENSKCPKYFLCQCSECYYGGQCQLNTNGFRLSLDAILSVYIYPNRNIFKQPRAVLISTIVSTILIIGGFINGILSLITFKNKKICESGCGIYLLTSSIIVLLTMIIFTVKFWILMFTQIGTIKNELFLKIECLLIDFFLQLCLTMDQWLTAFVSIERAFIVIKGVNFNKKKTKLVAKYIICALLLIAIITNIHDPIHRRLYEEKDDEEKRFWCIVEYKYTIRIIDYIINGFHFIVPFIINIISANLIIIIKTQQRRVVKRTEQNLRTILNEEIQQHRNLLIGPFVLIILAIPRLIITFASGCMKPTNNPWLFLSGYFISLIPPILTFILFVLPSTIYKEEFRKAIKQYRKIFQRSS